MKRVLLTLVVASVFSLVQAQEEMKQTFVTEIDHSFEYTAQSDRHGYSYASSGKEITVLDNATGKIRWNKKYSEISEELSKVDEIIPLWDADAIFLFDRKMGKDKMACIDVNDGKLLWITAKYQGVEEDNVVYIREMDAFAVTTKANLTMVKARTGEELWVTDKFKGIVGYYLYDANELILLNMKSSLVGSVFAGFKNQIMKLNTKTGDVIWEQTYRGLVEKKILTGERLVSMREEEGKIFLFLNGIQVYDAASGKSIWSAAFDQTPDVVKAPAGAVRFGAYGVVANPVVEGDYVYVLDMENKKNQFLKKYHLKSGKMVWRSAEIENARAIPGLYVVGNRVVLQVGGQVELQHIVRKRETDGSYTITRTIEMENVKPMNVKCYDAVTGEQKWESEKMKKGLTNMFTSGQNLIVCSGKALYSIDIESGKENYEKEIKEDNIGLADLILSFNDQVIIIGEKGVSSRSIADGALKASSKFKRSTPVSHNNQYLFGNTMVLVTKNADFAAYDLNTCQYKVFDGRKGATAYLQDDGSSLYVFESGGMMRKSKFTKLSAK